MAKKIDLKNYRTLSREEFISKMINEYPAALIADSLYDYLQDDDEISPITITKEQFMKYFKVKGYKNVVLDGDFEVRGRPVANKATEKDIVSDKGERED